MRTSYAKAYEQIWSEILEIEEFGEDSTRWEAFQLESRWILTVISEPELQGRSSVKDSPFASNIAYKFCR